MIMEKEQQVRKDQKVVDENEKFEASELVLFQVPECYVYMIPPRKSTASYRADEWDVNRWAWEGILKVVSKGEECSIRLEDKSTGEMYARAFLQKGEPHPVEAVIDSSRYFVLRIEENIGGRIRHAFIGVGFRERTEAYDFQAALHDHMKYLNKKKTAAEMEEHFQKASSVDYSIKEGETIVLQFKNNTSSRSQKSTAFERGEKGVQKELGLSIAPPPPPPGLLSPAPTEEPSPISPSKLSLGGCSKDKFKEITKEDSNSAQNQSADDTQDDDFGDFQTAG